MMCISYKFYYFSVPNLLFHLLCDNAIRVFCFFVVFFSSPRPSSKTGAEYVEDKEDSATPDSMDATKHY